MKQFEYTSYDTGSVLNFLTNVGDNNHTTIICFEHNASVHAPT